MQRYDVEYTLAEGRERCKGDSIFYPKPSINKLISVPFYYDHLAPDVFFQIMDYSLQKSQSHSDKMILYI